MGPQAVPNTVGIQFGLATHLELVKNGLKIIHLCLNFLFFFLVCITEISASYTLVETEIFMIPEKKQMNRSM